MKLESENFELRTSSPQQGRGPFPDAPSAKGRHLLSSARTIKCITNGGETNIPSLFSKPPSYKSPWATSHRRRTRRSPHRSSPRPAALRPPRRRLSRPSRPPARRSNRRAQGVPDQVPLAGRPFCCPEAASARKTPLPLRNRRHLRLGEPTGPRLRTPSAIRSSTGNGAPSPTAPPCPASAIALIPLPATGSPRRTTSAASD